MHYLALPLDSYALCTTLTLVSSSKSILLGKQIHAYASKSGWMSSIFVGGALIDLYGKSGDVYGAHQLFDEIPLKNTVCANALLMGYIESRHWVEGLSLVRKIHGLCLDADGFTISAILRICAELPAAAFGMQVHAYLIRKIESEDAFVLSSLIEMYGKCGLAGKARLVFESAWSTVRKGDIILWTSMLNAYGRNGCLDDVIKAYEEMLAEGTRPDEIAVLAVLSACCHSGEFVKGLRYFELAMIDYRVVLGSEHYGCVVDMLCRAGELERAWKFANEMVLKKGSCGSSGLSVTVWGALLSACRLHGNADIGKLAAEKAIELDPGNVGIYIELSNLYARVGMWDELGKLREVMKEKQLEKHVGSSRLE
ncbi:putative pentatricopeptide repeat-containing protein At3g49142 [Typha latifolia]|uniref:putative pentatricopeptide repeat-containing protein At3g49142 n=1 Tax=Typha latifolia TaxID=4733 RepID=UPI003C2C5CF5